MQWWKYFLLDQKQNDAPVSFFLLNEVPNITVRKRFYR